MTPKQTEQKPTGCIAKIYHRWQQKAFVCVGLDIDVEKLPSSLASIADVEDRVKQFIYTIVHSTHNYACAYKLNSAHYERLGSIGFDVMKAIIAHIHDTHPGIPVILDAKRGDIDTTNAYYAKAIFDELGADAITVHPYMGRQSLLPFLVRQDKGVVIMASNSTPGAEEFQDVFVSDERIPLYEYICRHAASEWNENGNCIVTASALDAEKLRSIRSTIGEMPILVLGVGAQGGDAAKCMQTGQAKHSLGLIIHASRSILYASRKQDYSEAASKATRKLNEVISQKYHDSLRSQVAR